MFTLGFVFMAMTLLVFIGYGLMASQFRQYIIRSERLSMHIQRVFAGGFAALGLKLALSERV
jgi:threonine/homoserine/homoserine lactone efflux protein